MTDSIQVFPPWAWVAFLGFISCMLAIDLGLVGLVLLVTIVASLLNPLPKEEPEEE